MQALATGNVVIVCGIRAIHGTINGFTGYIPI